MYFSKSKYTAFRDCPKLCWLQKNKPQVEQFDSMIISRLENGRAVGDLAKGLFGSFVETTTYKEDGKLDLSAMIAQTKLLLENGVENICEAAFDFNGLYCAVDILHKENDGYAIYEVKSSTSINDYYYADVAYQKYVLQKCGVNVVGAHIVVLNKDYVRHGEIDVTQLFSIDGGADISAKIAEEEKLVPNNLVLAEHIIDSEAEPNINIGKQCGDWCGYWKYCSRHLPQPSVFDLYGFRDKWECYQKGILSFDDIVKHNITLKKIPSLQIEYAHNDSEAHIERDNIQNFLNTLLYPLYFLDFETMQCPIPPFDGCKPNEQIPFQYSLHYVQSKDSEAQHKEFLADSINDPRRSLAERLCQDIPDNACILAYNSFVESGIVGKLADKFADLRNKLLNIQSGIIDLLPVFRNGYYYNKAMGGSFSIKSVLPALFPNDPELDYHNLDGVHNGTEAMCVFPQLATMSNDEAQKVRTELLQYCKLDTLAMVKVWQKLMDVCK